MLNSIKESFLDKPIRFSKKIALVVNIHKNFCEIIAEGLLAKTMIRLPFNLSLKNFDNKFQMINLYPIDNKKQYNISLLQKQRPLYLQVLRNQIKGVFGGYRKILLLKGMGFKAKINYNLLLLKLGWSHLINYKIPFGVYIHVCKPKSQKIAFRTVCKYLISIVVTTVCNFKYPNPYTGKGILIKKKIFPRKAGKQSKNK